MSRVASAILGLLVLLVFTGADACRHGGRWAGDTGAAKGYPARHGAHRHTHDIWPVPQEAAMRVNPVPASDASVGNGRTIFTHCIRCHGAYGWGDGEDAPTLSRWPSNLHHTARHDLDGEIAWKIMSGRDPMPAWKGTLSDGQVWDLVNFLRVEMGGRHGGRSCGRGARHGTACAPPAAIY